MIRYLKVKDDEKLVRDVVTNAIINTDSNEYLNYIQEREKKLSHNQKVDDLEKQIFELKSDLDEIKNLLRNLANES